jgi:hypothetical protein
MLALPLALMPLVVALNLIASAGQPVRTNTQLCEDLEYELTRSVLAGILDEEEASTLHDRCLSSFPPHV